VCVYVMCFTVVQSAGVSMSCCICSVVAVRLCAALPLSSFITVHLKIATLNHSAVLLFYYFIILYYIILHILYSH
jgi:hypothetical protein